MHKQIKTYTGLNHKLVKNQKIQAEECHYLNVKIIVVLIYNSIFS